MPLVYVFAASKMEAQPVLVLAAGNGTPGQGSTALIIERGAERFAVIITGMGTRNAEAKAEATLGLAGSGARGGPPLGGKPDAVLVIGLCGGLTESLPEDRIVAYTECLSTGTNKAPPLQCSPSLTDGIVRRLQEQGITVDRVIGITSPRIATTKADRLALAKSGAAAVDMESYPIVSAAARAGVPAVVLRVVSDSLDTEMPDFNPALNAQGALDGRRALWIALGSPLETYRLLAANKRAMERLTPAVKLILESDCFSKIGSATKN
jgi:nucleoside phosphorylase